MSSIGLVVLTFNGGDAWKHWLEAFKAQQIKPQFNLVIDSSSEDETVQLARSNGLEVIVIPRESFNHGGTRQIGLKYMRMREVEIIIFLTQDAILRDPDSLERLVRVFQSKSVGAAFGRQLPRLEASHIEAHARHFNYPAETRIKSIRDVPDLGLKTVFISNSFAAYRRDAIEAVGGFPQYVIFGEDTCVAAKMVLAGWEIAYVADAVVCHSHGYSFLQEFRRYFDIGVLHAREPWIQENFGRAGNEGLRYVISELRYLGFRYSFLIPAALVRNSLKFLGYKLGKYERKIPLRLKKKLSMHRKFWEEWLAVHGNSPK
jgi:rhamnosyltransferase